MPQSAAEALLLYSIRESGLRKQFLTKAHEDSSFDRGEPVEPLEWSAVSQSLSGFFQHEAPVDASTKTLGGGGLVLGGRENS
jgi:hypothetical protein